MVAIVSQDLQSGTLEVEAEHAFSAEDSDIKLESPVGWHRTCAGKRSDNAAIELDTHSVVQLHLRTRRRHHGEDFLWRETR